MCDYSAEATTTRDAMAGDRLVSDFIDQHHGTRGFIAESDRSDNPVAVCLLPGALLTVSGIPERLQRAWNVGESASAVFDQRIVDGAKPGFYHRDGVIFEGQSEHVSLQAFEPGIRATVELIPGERATAATRVLEDA